MIYILWPLKVLHVQAEALQGIKMWMARRARWELQARRRREKKKRKKEGNGMRRREQSRSKPVIVVVQWERREGRPVTRVYLAGVRIDSDGAGCDRGWWWWGASATRKQQTRGDSSAGAALMRPWDEPVRLTGTCRGQGQPSVITNCRSVTHALIQPRHVNAGSGGGQQHALTRALPWQSLET